MRVHLHALTAAAVLLPGLAAAQQPQPQPAQQQPAQQQQQQQAPVANPVATAFREDASRAGKNLIAAAEEMPAGKYAYKPTPAQMSFGDIVVHLAQGNDYFCGTIAGTKAPTRTKIAATDGKATLVARLRETFQFCDQALATLDDSKLGEPLPFFGGTTRSRAAIMFVTTGDWADHYSQSAIYLRLNRLLPPTAKRQPAAAQ